MTTTPHTLRKAALLLATLVALVAPSGAAAVGGSYVISGGNVDQQAQVRSALQATSFNWSVVPVTVKINLVAGADTQAIPGAIQIDTNLLDSGMFAWGIVQHEYAHQVDWYVLGAAARGALARSLGGVTWGIGITGGYGVAHDQLTGERFADELTWAFWPTVDNAVEPASRAFSAKSFRAYLGALLRPDPVPAAATAAALASWNGTPAAPARLTNPSKETSQ